MLPKLTGLIDKLSGVLGTLGTLGNLGALGTLGEELNTLDAFAASEVECLEAPAVPSITVNADGKAGEGETFLPPLQLSLSTFDPNGDLSRSSMAA